MHEPHLIRVFEFQSLRTGEAGFTRQHWESLAKWAEKQPERYVEVWGDSIRFLQWVGVMEVGDLVIEVLPKAEADRANADLGAIAAKWRRILLELLHLSGYLDVAVLDEALLESQDRTLLDVVFEQFSVAVEALLRAGLVKRYRVVAKDRNCIKGRIDHAQNLARNLFHAERIRTSAYEYDQQNLPNWILKEATEACVRFAPSEYSRRRARQNAIQFPDWPTKRVRAEDFRLLHLDRKTLRYRRALDLARLILAKQRSIDLHSGGDHVFSLLFDMNNLWETAMLVRLQRECTFSQGVRTRGQSMRVFWRSNAGASKVLRPDILIEPPGKPPIIVDTKWKVLSSPVPGDEDLRQIFSYDVMWKAQQGYLLFPKANELAAAEGAYTALVDGIERRCNVIFASPDPRLWKQENLLSGLIGESGQ